MRCPGWAFSTHCAAGSIPAFAPLQGVTMQSFQGDSCDRTYMGAKRAKAGAKPRGKVKVPDATVATIKALLKFTCKSDKEIAEITSTRQFYVSQVRGGIVREGVKFSEDDLPK